MKYSLAIIFLTVTVSAVVSMGVPARAGSSVSEHTHRGFSLGAGYERYMADWKGTGSNARVRIEQNRFYLHGDYVFAGRITAGFRLGTASAISTGFDPLDVHPHGYIDYGFEPFGSILLSCTPIGAARGTSGLALDIRFELSAFSTYTDESSVYLYDCERDRLYFEARREIRDQWEGSLAVLFVAGSNKSRFGAGPVILRSGAFGKTELDWGEYTDTWDDYMRSDQDTGMLFTLDLTPSASTAVHGYALFGPTIRLGVWVTRLLFR